MSTIRIELADELLELLHDGKTITLQLQGPKEREPKIDSLPARVIKWAARRKSFTTAQVEETFEVSRAHASMIVSRLASGNFPIVRIGRGVYCHKDKME